MLDRRVNYGTGTNCVSVFVHINLRAHTDWIMRHCGDAIGAPSVQREKVNWTTYIFHACMGSAGELIHTCVHTWSGKYK